LRNSIQKQALADLQFAKKLTLTANNTTYTMYYNEILEGTTTKIDDKKIEHETKSFLYGEVVISGKSDNQTYYVIGSREIESENKKGVIENESELELLFTTEKIDISTTTTSFEQISLDNFDNYVLIEQEAEADEVEFEYTTKINGTIKSVEIEWENKNGKEELEIEIENNNVKTKYDIKKVSDNKYSVKLKKDNKKTLFFIEKVDGNFVVTEA